MSSSSCFESNRYRWPQRPRLEHVADHLKIFLPLSGGAPKKISFSLGKKAAVTSDAKRGQQLASHSPQNTAAAGGRGRPPQGVAHTLGFEDAALASEKPKAQKLLSISEGQLEVEGGNVKKAPRVIPCRNPLPLSDYRVRITERDASVSAEAEDSRASSRTTPADSNGIQAAEPVWGLQIKKVKTDAPSDRQQRTSPSSESNPTANTTDPSTASAGGSANDNVTARVKTELHVKTEITDEEAAASLIAEARGEHHSGRVVPILARNSVLAELRQKYRKELESGRLQQQKAGEPDKVLLQRELELLPDAPTPASSAYEAMPVEEFGAAMLRGMGLKSIPTAAAPVKRKAYTRAGLGSEREIDRLRERLEERRRHEEAAKRGQKVFISLKAKEASEE
ncbi:hypothetical protein Emed_000369 [Eimeria media]